jgi:hypothetical protein
LECLIDSHEAASYFGLPFLLLAFAEVVGSTFHNGPEAAVARKRL